MSARKLTREELIYLWKTEGGNIPWARWCKIHDIPEHNPGFIEELLRVAQPKNKSCAATKGVRDLGINERKD